MVISVPLHPDLTSLNQIHHRSFRHQNSAAYPSSRKFIRKGVPLNVYKTFQTFKPQFFNIYNGVPIIYSIILVFQYSIYNWCSNIQYIIGVPIFNISMVFRQVNLIGVPIGKYNWCSDIQYIFLTIYYFRFLQFKKNIGTKHRNITFRNQSPLALINFNKNFLCFF